MVVMEHIFVADTNLFFECKKLEDIPWSDLGVDPLAIILTKPVISEVDKHKKSGGRTRKRALAVSARIREMLKSEVLEKELRKSEPRVSFRLAPVIRPDPNLADVLDYDTNDDRIVGIVSTMVKDNETGSVCFLTDDSVAASTAQSVGVPFRFIPEAWKRPPEQTTEAKRIKELEKDLATYRAQEPSIVLESFAGEMIGTSVVRRVALPLRSDQVETLVGQLRTDHPIQNDFVFPKSEQWNDGTEVTYQAPAPEVVKEYKTEAYPGWLSNCRSIIEKLHEGRIQMESPLRLTWGVTNEGTRPAAHVRVTFVAEGNVRLRRLPTTDLEDGDDGDKNEESDWSALPQLPPPPKAPQVQRIVKRPAVATRKPEDARASLAGPWVGDLDRMISAGSAFSDLTRAAAAMGRHHEVLSRSASVLADKPEVFATARSLDVIPHFETPLPPKHDKEAFYYDDWPSNEPVESGALTCDLYRHQNGEELFELEVVFPQEGDIRGAVVCTVHAENLTEPVSLRTPVGRLIEEYSLFELAQAMVESCGD